MRKVTINASQKYDVVIGNGILDSVGKNIELLGRAANVCIVTDTNVGPLYKKRVIASLENSGIGHIDFTIKAGESSKNGSELLNLLNFLAENHISRSDVIIALGGGVVGDLAGFAASIYLRGVRFIQMPTTLLAAVDSSVGGKTAIDLDAGKNLAGSFYQPAMVLCDYTTFSTLPADVFRDGCAEVIKYGCICDEDFFNSISSGNIAEQLEEVIAHCVEIKAEIVSEDEFDTGKRQLLNFGHTAAHAIEKLSCFRISHGSAVAIGMALITRAAANMGICNDECVEKIEHILNKYSLPISAQYSAKELADIAKNDKKIAGGSINLVLPREVGDCFLHNINIEEIEGIFERGIR